MQEKGFFGSLFDVSFKSLAMTKIIRVLYILVLIGFGLALLAIVISAANQGGSEAVAILIFAPLVLLLYLMYIRLALEALIVVFNIGQNTAELVRLQGGRGSSGGLSTLKAGDVPPTSSAPAQQPAAAQAGGGQAEGWYPDPQGQKRLRYWDGSAWTEHTSD
jgi:hypothetical protein